MVDETGVGSLTRALGDSSMKTSSTMDEAGTLTLPFNSCHSVSWDSNCFAWSEMTVLSYLTQLTCFCFIPSLTVVMVPKILVSR